jgi:hypothetical protein
VKSSEHEDDSAIKPIIRIRSVLWREVAHGHGNPKGLHRASVNLPVEAINILELQGRGDIVAFVMKKKTKDVMLTNYYGSQPATIYRTEQDPEVLLDRLLAQVLVLKSRKSEISEKWENHEIEDGEFVQKTKEISKQLKDITENVRQILDRSFRGSTLDIKCFMQNKMKSFYDEYANSFISYTEDLVSKIHSLEKSVDALNSANAKGLFNIDEYNEEKDELESQLNSLRALAKGTVQLLTLK